MQKVILATNNAGKRREFAALLAPFHVSLLPMSEFNVVSPEETGASFVENALIKARAAALASGLPALADDSGLCVDYLKGAPGIYSSRFAGVTASDRDNCDKLLASLSGVPAAQRGAHFVSVIVYLKHALDPLPLIAQGLWFGEIAQAPSGSAGFGYDPLFYLPSLKQTAAELSQSQKNQLSHRASAFKKLSALIAEYEIFPQKT